MRAMFRKPLVVIFVLCGAMFFWRASISPACSMARATARERELATRLPWAHRVCASSSNCS